ncbi:23S rRNA (uracil(1939)-C(5))-methyltransferase RlmD [Xylanibacillus composti]|uniref:tRNA (Uracil-5-)-methyltransferase n=1 Tax=Xylanibacillus composti TaxID=1572762 RepID=A0A8J4H3X3_9BACL|nr:23S rRNA (uracil(1939)-C(5))-methyltransferase RlmD [Xylanibacillus composti]GIQ70547.1 tRNA (uracil-5-)-methyltransferase [Xylanibacillus composti]
MKDNKTNYSRKPEPKRTGTYSSQTQSPTRQHAGPSPRTASAEEVRTGDRLVVTIKRIGINGEGVGYYKRKAVFIDRALPNEVVKAKVTQVEPGFLKAEIVEIEKRSPDRQQPPCAVYEACGGCQLQHMTYKGQLQAKEELVREAFRRYTRLAELPLRPILGMEDPWGYRNKAQLQAGRDAETIVTGLYAAGSHRLVDISGCPIHHPVVNQVVEQVKAIMEELHISIYNERARKGAVRTIVARVGQASGQVQLTLITAEERIPHADRLVARVREKLPMVATIAHNIHKGKSPLVFGETTHVLWGNERLEETLGDVRFSLSPRAFFQLNPAQTIKLYNAAQEAAALSGTELVVDAYCGTGTIGLWLAPQAREVRGIEVIPEAVRDARDNARTSGITNAKFYEGRAERLLPQWVKQGIRPDVVVVDPPRTGCERPLLDAIAKARPARFVYVSCNPSTLAKDCQVLLDSGYRLEWVQPVDMFPHTAHVECVLKICRVDT